jgi:hypothetical protein
MTQNIEELRVKLGALEGERDSLYLGLAPLARASPDGRMRWRDSDLADWLGVDLDTVRARIVSHLTEFSVDEDCRSALLDAVQFAALTGRLKAPRIQDLDFVEAQIQLATSRLAELGE